MRTTLDRIRGFYGANPLHLLALIVCFAILGYILSVTGLTSLWNPEVWWQSELVWFVGAIVAHDLVLFPLYALADRSLGAAMRAVRPHSAAARPRVSALNYLRVPALGTGLSFLLFFPGIIQQGQPTYLAATGQTQEPFLGRWLLLTAALFAVSAVAYAARLALTPRAKITTSSAAESAQQG